MIRRSLINLNSDELKYYPFMVTLDKCSGSCNSGNDLSTKICIPSKTKHIIVKTFCHANNMKMENNKLKKICIKNFTCNYFNDITKFENFDLDNILIDEKSHRNILIYDISYKTLIGPNPVCIRFNKIDGFIRFYDGTRYLILLGPKKYHAIGLDIL